MRKVETFTNDKVKVIIIWNTRKIQPLFNNKILFTYFFIYLSIYLKLTMIKKILYQKYI